MSCSRGAEKRFFSRTVSPSKVEVRLSRERRLQRAATVSLSQTPSISQLTDQYRARLLQKLANPQSELAFELEDSSIHRPSTARA